VVSVPWDRLAGYQLDPSTLLVLGTGTVGLAAVAVDRVWRRTRYVITIVHEAGHALAALATGRRLTGIRLHSDTSGLTLSVGRPDGPGMVATTAAGYLCPSLLGLCGVGVLAAGWVTVTLWVAVAMLLAMLVMIRNVYGAVPLLLTGAVLVLVAWYGSADVQAAFGHAATWFLLFGAVRPLAELRRLRRSGAARNSDVDELSRLTRLPAWLWLALLAGGSLAALAGGGWLLLR
jgi:Peptidase M50B-like